MRVGWGGGCADSRVQGEVTNGVTTHRVYHDSQRPSAALFLQMWCPLILGERNGRESREPTHHLPPHLSPHMTTASWNWGFC